MESQKVTISTFCHPRAGGDKVLSNTYRYGERFTACPRFCGNDATGNCLRVLHVFMVSETGLTPSWDVWLMQMDLNSKSIVTLKGKL
jgi:hypothetical protein